MLSHVSFGVEDIARSTIFYERILAPLGYVRVWTTPNRTAVDAFHAAAIGSGGKDDGAPGLRPRYSPTYYAAFVIDPDGYKLEAVHQ
jgi:catechol 2,3-dioxygenase-like lactoylglutathione lyase family enzyme